MVVHRADGRSGPRFAAAADWVARHPRATPGLAVALERAFGGGAAGWRVSVAEDGGGAAGVAVVTPAGQWLLDADGPAAAAALVADGFDGTPPTKLTVTGALAGAVRERLAAYAAVPRAHDLLVMRCEALADAAVADATAGGARWAIAADRPALEAYQPAYDRERRTVAPAARDWDDLIARRQIAVLPVDGAIVALVMRSGATDDRAYLGGTFTFPGHRQRGHARRVTSFLVAALLAERPAVELVVDDDNAAAIALYRALGFREVDRCHMAYLEARAP